MEWNFRIVRYHDGSGYGLHEVFYNDDGVPVSMTEKPDGFAADPDEGPESIIEQLDAARRDAVNQPVLDEPEKWPGV